MHIWYIKHLCQSRPFCSTRFKTGFVMVTILAFSNTAPFNSVIICCTTVITTFNILSRGTLFTLEARTDWLVRCLCWGKAAETPGSIMAGPTTATWCVWGCCSSSVLPWSTTVKDAWSGEVGREHPSYCRPQCPLRLLAPLLLRLSAALTGWFFFPPTNQQLQLVGVEDVFTSLTFSIWFSLCSLSTDPIENTISNISSIMVSHIHCSRNMFIGRSLATAVSLGSIISVSQLPWYNISGESFFLSSPLWCQKTQKMCFVCQAVVMWYEWEVWLHCIAVTECLCNTAWCHHKHLT